jgi:hypothetical protein
VDFKEAYEEKDASRCNLERNRVSKQAHEHVAKHMQVDTGLGLSGLRGTVPR